MLPAKRRSDKGDWIGLETAPSSKIAYKIFESWGTPPQGKIWELKWFDDANTYLILEHTRRDYVNQRKRKKGSSQR